MSWFRIDDQAHAHRKFRRASKKHQGAVGLWMLCGSLASSAVCDGSGHLMSDEVETMALSIGIRDWQKAADALVTCGDPGGVGLWERTDAGFQFHDWEHYREGGEEELRRVRKNAADRQRAKRERDRAGDASRDGVTERHVTDHVTPSRPPRPGPARPGPVVARERADTTATTATFPEEPDLTDLRRVWAAAVANVWGGLPQHPGDYPEDNDALAALWAEARAGRVAFADWPPQLEELLVRPWVEATRAAGGGAVKATNGWKPSRLVRWVNARDAAQDGPAAAPGWGEPTEDELRRAGALS